jgi:hypothetical protein
MSEREGERLWRAGGAGKKGRRRLVYRSSGWPCVIMDGDAVARVLLYYDAWESSFNPFEARRNTRLITALSLSLSLSLSISDPCDSKGVWLRQECESVFFAAADTLQSTTSVSDSCLNYPSFFVTRPLRRLRDEDGGWSQPLPALIIAASPRLLESYYRIPLTTADNERLLQMRKMQRHGIANE